MSHLVRGVCPHDCPDTCSWIVTVEDGRAVRMAGDPDHPFTSGFLCTKVARYVERTYHADRLLFPQIRAGSKGEGIATRFFNRIGASQLDRTICASAGTEGYQSTYGPRIGTDPESIGAAK